MANRGTVALAWRKPAQQEVTAVTGLRPVRETFNFDAARHMG